MEWSIFEYSCYWLLQSNLVDEKYNITFSDVENTLMFAFELPSPDQKILGVWKILAELYDIDEYGVSYRVSYSVVGFQVEETTVMYDLLYVVAPLGGIIPCFMIIKNIMDIRKKRSSENVAEVKDNEN